MTEKQKRLNQTCSDCIRKTMSEKVQDKITAEIKKEGKNNEGYMREGV